MRVLIVEDERRLAQTLADLMEAHNYGADIAYDGEEGLDNALSGIYDVILLDVMLPKRSGYEIVHALRKEGDKTPVLMLTARTVWTPAQTTICPSPLTAMNCWPVSEPSPAGTPMLWITHWRSVTCGWSWTPVSSPVESGRYG